MSDNGGIKRSSPTPDGSKRPNKSCIMPVDKSWLTNPNRSSPEYQQGLNSFIEMCKEQVDNRGNVRCACAKCHNSVLISFTKMKFHMHSFGFCRTYTEWIYHVESSFPPVVAVDDVAPKNDMTNVIENVMEEDTNLDEVNSSADSGGVRDDVEDLLKEVQSELYPGCTNFSSLDFLEKLMHIKVKNKWTNSSFDELLVLLQSSHPEGNKIPLSHYVAKKTLKNIGLECESIHVSQTQPSGEESCSSHLMRKPSSSTAPSSFDEVEQPPPPLTPAQIKELFQHPAFIDQLNQFMSSIKVPGRRKNEKEKKKNDGNDEKEKTKEDGNDEKQKTKKEDGNDDMD